MQITLLSLVFWRISEDPHGFEGTSEIQQLVIARAISGLRIE
jgi:alkylation response protein AidB-like acyl-CoA dehydrogenase